MKEEHTFFYYTLTLFLVANPIGNTPAFVSLVKEFDFEKQRKILFRESLFSCLFAIFFLFLGDAFLQCLSIEPYSLSLSGGLLLLLVALKMIFPDPPVAESHVQKREPFIVPIAIPLITGGGVLTNIMVNAKEMQNNLKFLGAILVTWIAVTAVVVSAPYIQKFLGKRGLLALEQLMGMILAMISIQILVNGTGLFLTSIGY